MNCPKIVLGRNTILLLRSEIRISFHCYGRTICASAYRRNELGGPSYHSGSRGFVCSLPQCDHDAYKYGIFSCFCS
jgi:hypothetical protein